MKTFSESQRFNRWWIWTIAVIVSLSPSLVAFWQWHKGMLDWHYPVIGVSITLLMLVTFRLACLMTDIDEKGISYQFFLYHMRPIRIGWDQVGRAYIRQYNVAEYGGRGVKYTTKRKSGAACTISGNKGLQIVLKNGKKLLLGTRRPDDIAAVLAYLKTTGKTTAEIVGPSAIPE